MKVLLATDDSEHATHAASLLAHLPHREPLNLTVLFVNYAPEFHGSREVVEWMEKSLSAAKDRADETFRRIEEMFAGANATLKNVFVEGQVGRTIVEEAQTRGIELIVLGAIGHSTIDRLLLGSTSDFVAVHAPCSVLVVRPTAVDKHAPRICWAFDDSEPSQRAMDQFCEFDWGNQTHIDIVHSLPLPQAYTEIPIVLDIEEIKAAMIPKLQEAAEELHGITQNVTPYVIDSLSVGQGLIKFASDNRSDMIVMGDTGRGLLSRFLMGSVSRFVLRHAKCSVWIAR